MMYICVFCARVYNIVCLCVCGLLIHVHIAVQEDTLLQGRVQWNMTILFWEMSSGDMYSFVHEECLIMDYLCLHAVINILTQINTVYLCVFV